MEDIESQNWLRLQLLLQQVCVSLRKIFLEAFKQTFVREWDRTQSHQIADNESLKKLPTSQRDKIAEGDVDKWDITLLRAVLTSGNLLKLTIVPEIGLKRMVDIRNDLEHLPNKRVTKEQFREWWDAVFQVLLDFGNMSEADLEQLRQERRLCGVAFVHAEKVIDDFMVEECGRLRKDGNVQFGKGNYPKAIQCYTQAIEKKGIYPCERDKLYSNRCIAHVRQFQMQRDGSHLQEAQKDAEKATELAPGWWRGYFRLGQVYVAMEKFQKAEQCFCEALAKDSPNCSIDDTITDVRTKRGERDRMDVLDPSRIPKGTADIVESYNQKTGSNINPRVVKLSQQAWLTSGTPNLVSHEYCRLGHRHRTGSDGFPRSSVLSAEHFKLAADLGNAEGMYNLGVMTMEGEGVPLDATLGIELLRKAAAQPPMDGLVSRLGVADAEHKLGMCYENGIGVQKDISEAKQWYERATFHGCPNAANNLGLLYESGFADGSCNFTKAEEFYQLGALSGLAPDSNAMLNLARLYEQKGDLLQAQEYCQRARQHGNILPFLDELSSRIKSKMDNFITSGVPQWEIENHLSNSNLTIKERMERYIRAKNPDFDVLLKQCKILENKLKPPLPTHLTTKSNFSSKELERCASYSSYGKHLWAAKQHSENALRMLGNFDLETPPSPSQCKKFVEQFAAGARIEYMVFEWSVDETQQALSIIRHLLKLGGKMYDEEVCICYVALQGLVSPELTIAFLDQCVLDYPKCIFFLEWRAALYAFSGCHEEALRDINAALKMDPNNVELRHDKAGMMHLACPNFKPEVVVKEYEQFLDLAPRDHRKVPESYYAIANLNLPEVEKYEKLFSKNGNWEEIKGNIAEVKRLYDLGVAAERDQLQFFLPYKSNRKSVVGIFVTTQLKNSSTLINL